MSALPHVMPHVKITTCLATCQNYNMSRLHVRTATYHPENDDSHDDDDDSNDIDEKDIWTIKTTPMTAINLFANYITYMAI